MTTQNITHLQQTQTHNRRFTLIELMVVTGILAVLMSMLLPALGRARETAKRSVCRSNLKQIGLSLSIYADGNNEYLPYSASGLKIICDNHSLTPQTYLCPSDKFNHFAVPDLLGLQYNHHPFSFDLSLRFSF